MAKTIFEEMAVLMYGREIIFSPVCPYPSKKKTSPSECGGSGICAISNSTEKRFIPTCLQAAS